MMYQRDDSVNIPDWKERIGADTARAHERPQLLTS